jgi:hypothetical protein
VIGLFAAPYSVMRLVEVLVNVKPVFAGHFQLTIDTINLLLLKFNFVVPQLILLALCRLYLVFLVHGVVCTTGSVAVLETVRTQCFILAQSPAELR